MKLPAGLNAKQLPELLWHMTLSRQIELREELLKKQGKGWFQIGGRGLEGLVGCALAMDKCRAREVMAARGVPMPAGLELSHGSSDDAADRVLAGCGLPAVVKDPVGGSSIGPFICREPEELRAALADALRGLRMFEKVKIPVLGLVENMSSFVCPGCGEATPLFGDGGGVEVARQNDLPLLAKLPLDIRIRKETDAGSPTVVTEPDSPLGLAFRDLALHTVARLAQRPRDYKGAFPKVVVEKT